MPIRSLKFILLSTLFTIFAQSSFADSGLTAEESDSIIKEDIAATQVLIEVCPALTANNPRIISSLNSMTHTFLKELHNPSITLEQLKQDAEYQTIFKEAKADAIAVDTAEQKSACEDLLNM